MCERARRRQPVSVCVCNMIFYIRISGKFPIRLRGLCVCVRACACMRVRVCVFVFVCALTSQCKHDITERTHAHTTHTQRTHARTQTTNAMRQTG